MPTPNLGLTYLEAGQAQKEVVINANMDLIDAAALGGGGGGVVTSVADSATIDMVLASGELSASVIVAGIAHNSLSGLTTGDPHTQYKLRSEITTSGNSILGLATPGANTLYVLNTSGAWVPLTVGTGLSLAGTTLSATGATPAGSNTQVQFNNGGAFGASANLTWNGTKLYVNGTITGNAIEALGEYGDPTGPGISIGRGSDNSPRMRFYNGTSGDTWEQDMLGNTLRWYKPGVLHMQLTTSTLSLQGKSLTNCSAVPSDISIQRVIFAKAGVDAGNRSRLNFIDGKGVAITVADNAGSTRGDITVRAKRHVTVTLMGGLTPAGTGADDLEVEVPYDPSDGTTSLTWNIRRVFFRRGTAGAGTSTVQVERYTGTAAFSGTNVLNTALSISSGNEAAATSGFSASTLASGTKLRANVTALGAGDGKFLVTVLLEEA